MLQEKKKRPDTLVGQTYKIETNAGNLFLTVNSHEEKPFEVFVRVGKTGGDVMCLCETLGRLVSLTLRYGLPKDEIIQQLKGVGGEGLLIPTVPDAIAKALGEGI